MPAESFRRSLSSIAAAALAAQTVFGLGCGGPANRIEPANPEVRTVESPRHGPLLWRVEGASGPSYLFGTIHLGATLSDVGPEVTRALGDAETFVSEADLDGGSELALAELAILPAGEKLEAQIGADAFSELIRLLSPGLGREQLDTLQPWLAYTSALQVLYGGEASIDSALTARAKAAGKTMVYLETWRFQLGLLAEQIGADDLKGILDPSSNDRRTIEALLEAYRAGDFAAVQALIASPEAIASDPGEFKALFEDRNRAWVPLLVPHLRRGGAFVAVGAGHFAGDVGLLTLLRQAGIEATRVIPETRASAPTAAEPASASSPPAFAPR